MNKKKRSPKTLTEINQAKILKQIIMTPHPYPKSFLPRYPVLISSYINERQNMTLDIEIEKSKWNVGDVTCIMGYYPRNGWVGDTKLALNITY